MDANPCDPRGRSRCGARARRSRVLVTALLALPLAATGCGGPTPAEPAASASSSATASAAERPVWDLVVMGDSVWIDIGAPFARAIEDARGVDVRLHTWINPDLGRYTQGGERSADLLARLRTDEQLRADIGDAEIILFDVPMGVINDICTSDPHTAGVEEVAACLSEASAAYRADVGPIFDELVTLRDPSQAMVRVTDVWQFFYPTFQAAGTLDVARSAWQEMNGAVIDAADRSGIPVIRAYDAFTGPQGERDPVAAGDVSPDQVHLTSQGQTRLIAMVLDLGFAPLG